MSPRREVTVSTSEQQSDIEERLRRDMTSTLRQHGLPAPGIEVGELVEDLVRDAMHHIDPLLIEVNFDE